MSTLSKFVVATLGAACVLWSSACGDTEATATAPLPKIVDKSIGSCLVEAGASRAVNANDLSFLAQSEADEQVSKAALAFDRRARQFVRYWTGPSPNGPAPTWLLWFGQPYSAERSPMEIAELHPPKSYVLFIDHPTRAQRKDVAKCIEF